MPHFAIVSLTFDLPSMICSFHLPCIVLHPFTNQRGGNPPNIRDSQINSALLGFCIGLHEAKQEDVRPRIRQACSFYSRMSPVVIVAVTLPLDAACDFEMYLPCHCASLTAALG
jgi:hypothetical protein